MKVNSELPSFPRSSTKVIESVWLSGAKSKGLISRALTLPADAQHVNKNVSATIGVHGKSIPPSNEQFALSTGKGTPTQLRIMRAACMSSSHLSTGSVGLACHKGILMRECVVADLALWLSRRNWQSDHPQCSPSPQGEARLPVQIGLWQWVSLDLVHLHRATTQAM